MELLKAVLFGIVEGVTEWLPISSTGHLILLNEFITLNVSDEFRSMFDVVIQLGAILAVIVLFFHKLNPFSPRKTEGEKKQRKGLRKPEPFPGEGRNRCRKLVRTRGPSAQPGSGPAGSPK